MWKGQDIKECEGTHEAKAGEDAWMASSVERDGMRQAGLVLVQLRLLIQVKLV